MTRFIGLALALLLVSGSARAEVTVESLFRLTFYNCAAAVYSIPNPIWKKLSERTSFSISYNGGQPYSEQTPDQPVIAPRVIWVDKGATLWIRGFDFLLSMDGDEGEPKPVEIGKETALQLLPMFLLALDERSGQIAEILPVLTPDEKATLASWKVGVREACGDAKSVLTEDLLPRVHRLTRGL